MRIAIVLTVLVVALSGCAARLQPATTIDERIAYSEASAQGIIKTLAALTCKEYTSAGACTEPGRPLHPARSLGYLDQISKVRQALKASEGMSDAGGQCLGQPSTRTACLSLAQEMLAEIEKILTDVKKGS